MTCDRTLFAVSRLAPINAWRTQALQKSQNPQPFPFGTKPQLSFLPVQSGSSFPPIYYPHRSVSTWPATLPHRSHGSGACAGPRALACRSRPLRSCSRTASSASAASFRLRLSIVRGGAKRMMLSCVGFAKIPRSLSPTHTSHAVTFPRPAWSITTAFRRPLPRTSEILSGNRDCTRCRCDRNSSPSVSALHRSGSPRVSFLR